MLADSINSGQITGGAATKGNDQDITTIKKMLIAIDDSEHRGKIIRYGLTIAKSLGADVTATHVIDRSSVAGLSDLGGLMGYFQRGNRAIEEELSKHAKEVLGEAEALAKKKTRYQNKHPCYNECIISCRRNTRLCFKYEYGSYCYWYKRQNGRT